MTEAWQAMADSPWVTLWVGIVIMVAFSRPSVDASKHYNGKYFGLKEEKDGSNTKTN
jgi:hypothetical protein